MRSLFWMILSVIVYGSLYPFDFNPGLRQEIVWLDWLLNIESRTTNGDRLSNLLMFIPLGYLSCHFFSGSQTIVRWPWRVTGSLVFCLLLATALQLMQFYTPHRVPAMGDVWFNSAGATIGVMMAFNIERWLAKNKTLQIQWYPHYAIPALLLLVWIMFQTFPYFFTFRSQVVIDSLSPLWNSEQLDWRQILMLIGYWMAFFVLLKKYCWFDARFNVLVIMVSLIIGLRLLSEHNQLDWNFFSSILIALLLVEYINQNWLARTALVGLLVTLLVGSFFPWKNKMLVADFNWIPLSTYLNGSLWINSHLFLERVFLFGSLIFFSAKIGLNWRWAIGLVTGLVIMIESLQQFFSLGEPDITEPLLALLMGWTFIQLRQHAQSAADESDNEPNGLTLQ